MVFPGAQALFAQGCCGNVNSEPVGGSWADVWRLGTILAGAVVKTAAEIRTEPEAKLACAYKPLEIPLEDPPPVEEAEAEWEAASAKLAEAEAQGDATRVRVQRGNVEWREKLLKLAREGAKNLKMRYDLQALAINDAAIVGLPGEVFVEYQLNIAAQSPFGFTSVLGVTNGCPCYIPTAAEFPHGGYEVEESVKLYGVTKLSPAIEQTILGGAQELLAELKG